MTFLSTAQRALLIFRVRTEVKLLNAVERKVIYPWAQQVLGDQGCNNPFHCAMWDVVNMHRAVARRRVDFVSSDTITIIFGHGERDCGELDIYGSGSH